MDAADMGLADDGLLRQLAVLIERGCAFEDLLDAEASRQGTMDDIAAVVDRGSGQQGLRHPAFRLSAEDVPAFVDQLIEAGFHHPGASAGLAIRLTNSVRGLGSESARHALLELLAAMEDAVDGDLTLRLVLDICRRELQ